MEKSKVARMPRELREQIEAMWRNGEFSLDELLGWIRERKPDAEISRTGLGRHLAKYKRTFDRIREAREVAGRCIEQLGENPRGDVARMLSQLLGSLAFTTLDEMGAEGKAPPDTKDLFFLANAIKNLASAEKTSVDRELKVRKEMKAEIEKKLDATKPGQGASGELDAATLGKAKEL